MLAPRLYGSWSVPIALAAVCSVAGCSDGGGDEPNGGIVQDGGVTPGVDGGSGGSVLPSAITCDAQNVCRVPVGDYDTDMTWGPDRTFVLSLEGQQGPANVTVRAPATLTILPGTEIYANGRLALVIDRGAKIEAAGTPDRPIVFSSAKAAPNRARGDWGGLIINGRAPANCAVGGSMCVGEGGSGEYGGSDAADDSGTLRYVRVEFAGAQIVEEDQYNGIAFQGVGSGTDVEYLHLHLAQDDGIEFFGGTVNARHVVVSGAGDDSLDWTFGWKGKVQHVAIVQYADDADSGFEADNNEDSYDRDPRSSPTIANVTIVGRAQSVGMVLRRGTAGAIWSSIVTGSRYCVDPDSIPSTFDQLTAGTLALHNMILSCVDGSVRMNDEVDGMMMPLVDSNSSGPVDASSLIMSQRENKAAEPMIDVERVAGSRPDFRPAAGSPALSGGATPPDSFFDSVPHVGAMGSEDWSVGWTEYPAN